MKIILTGSKGMIGNKIKKTLERSKYKVLPLLFDLSVEKNFDNFKISGNENYIVVHAAGEKKEDPLKLTRNNILATNNLVHYLGYSEKCKGIVFLSSIAVFGLQKGTIYEDSDIKPDTFYGFSKFVCEEIVSNTPNFVILRPTNVVFPTTSNIIGKIIYSTINQVPFSAWKESLSTKRDYVYIDDVVKAIISAIKTLTKNKTREKINIAQGKSYTLMEVVKMVEEITKRKLILEIEKGEFFRNKDLNVSNEKFMNLIKRKPLPLSDMIRSILREFLNEG